MSMDLTIDRKLLKWGTGYGLRLTAKEVAMLGLRAGEPVHAQVSRAAIKNDFSKLPKFDFGPWPKGKSVRDILDEDIDERFLGKAGRHARR